MAVIMTLEVPGGTVEQYERTNEILGIHGDADAPDGLVSHVAGVTDDGMLVVDVWDSEESLNRFFEERLGAALQESGIPPVEPQITKVHDIIPQGSGTEANVLVVIDFDVSTDVYDAMAATMDAHKGAGENHPAVSHVAGVKDGGGMLIVDVWESPEAFGEFAQSQIGPAAPDDMGEITPRFVPVHNRIRGRASATA
jgi:heme-degrading monooxygenase HmoA